MKASLLALTLSLSVPLTTAFAQTPNARPDTTAIELKDSSPSITISDDLYKAGNDVIVNAPVRGDGYMAGGTVHITKPVGKDLVVAGGTVVVETSVGDDVRIFGGDVQINGNVGGDVLVFGGTIRIAQNSSIGGDVYIMGEQVRIDGNVRGMARIEAKDVIIGGTLNGPAEIRAERTAINGNIMNQTKIASRTIGIGEKALFTGNLRYWREAGPMQLGKQSRGQAVYDMNLQSVAPTDDQDTKSMFAGLLAALSIYWLLATTVIIGVLLLITRTFFTDSAKKLIKTPGMSFLKGLAYFVATPIIVLLLLVTIIGIPLALIVAMHYVIALMLAKALTAIVWVRYIDLKYKYAWGPWAIFGLSIVAYLVLKLVSLIPFLGWIVCFVLVSMAFGSLLTAKWEKMKKVR
jgi:cytoskeletal protein CcmA (bactofilin family)